MSKENKKYTFKTGDNYNINSKFGVKKITFGLMDATNQIIEEINSIRAIEFEDIKGDDTINNLKMSQDQLLGRVDFATGLKKLLNKDDSLRLFKLMIKLFQKTILFDNHTKQFEDEMLDENNLTFWENQEWEDLESALTFFRTKT